MPAPAANTRSAGLTNCGAPARRPRVRWALVLTLVAVLAGSALRLAPMYAPFWLDELYTAWAADPALSLGELFPRRMLRDPQPVGYYPLMWLWHRLVGPGEAASRLLGGLAGALALPVTALLLRGAVSNVAVALGVSVLALGWSGVFFAHEARAYALLYALSGLGYALVLRGLALGATRRLDLALLAVGVAAGLVHYFGMVLGCALWCARAAGHWRQGRFAAARRDLYRMLALAAVFLLLLGPQLKHLRHLTGGAFWIRNDLGRFADGYAGMLWPDLLAQGAWLGLALLAGYGLLRTARVALPLWTGLAVSFAVPGLISLHTPLLLARYLIITVPPLVLGLALAASWRPAGWRRGAMVLAVGAIGISSARAYTAVRKEDWPGAAALVAHTLVPPGCPIPVYRWKPALYMHYLPADLHDRVVRLRPDGPVPVPPPGCPLVLWYGFDAHPVGVPPPVPVRVIHLPGQVLWVRVP